MLIGLGCGEIRKNWGFPDFFGHFVDYEFWKVWDGRGADEGLGVR